MFMSKLYELKGTLEPYNHEHTSKTQDSRTTKKKNIWRVKIPKMKRK
jgi:hypothetical protein